MGVDHVQSLGHLDGAVEYGLALRQDLAGVLRRLRPEIVIGMNHELTWGDGRSVNHADHRAGTAVLDACRERCQRVGLPRPGGSLAGDRQHYISGTAAPTHYVDVTDTIEAGVASLRQHRAYIELGTDFDPDAFLRDISGYGGMAAGCQYAVLFRLSTAPDGDLAPAAPRPQRRAS